MPGLAFACWPLRLGCWIETQCRLAEQDAARTAAAQCKVLAQPKQVRLCEKPNHAAMPDSIRPIRGLPTVSASPWQARLPIPAGVIRRQYPEVRAHSLRPWFLLPVHGRHRHARAQRAWPAPSATPVDGTNTRLLPDGPVPALAHPAV